MSGTGEEAEATVAAFLADLRRIRQGLLCEYPEFSGLAAVLSGVRSGGLPRRGRTAEGFAYSVHGRGCLLLAPDGTEIDVDLLPDGHEAFDVWRLGRAGTSRGTPPFPDDATLLSACRRLVDRGLLTEPEPGWFALTAPQR
ncbi:MULTISPECIES: hypothetical protein [unclassified Streptomyces]|uniref:DUF6896 domain-containing protein n=1 Tax=unclassified Streptomyces TaxID=2593676 RepID=UPI0022520F05|nr:MULTISPECIES: hypothetical protein [unclassified Streptomyces]MCX5142416.1 hypothetical protein [Streptomyces sp. NBC_00338]WSU60874.1 hypothetical protein OG450_24905 [Streptomyces sp. NBC_01104]